MEIIVTVLIAIVGLLAGMLVNYLADILPHHDRFIRPVCWHCGEMQPYLNYFVWPRRCSQCGKARRWRVWLVEVLAIVVAVWLWYNPHDRLAFFWAYALLAYFGFVIVMDMEHREVSLNIVGLLLGGVIGWLLHGWLDTLIGGLAGAGVMLLLYYFGIFVVKQLSKWREEETDEVALGLGDVYLAGVIGLLLGWPGIVAGLFLTVLLGGAISLLLVVGMALTKGVRAFTAIPYGPFLVIAAALLLFFRDWFLF
ncbi:MAG: prepilin peptidase [Anaerolineales bacterium]|nr:prepilin peptidase [Anaerolineales bacterium]